MKPENRKKTGKRRANAGSFKPGQSGNEGGRPKLTESEREAREARALARPSAVRVVVSIMEDPEVPPKDRVAAAKVILDGLEPLKIDLDANVKAEVSHDVKAEAVQSPERMRTIIAVLRRAGQLEENTETAEPVETKPEGA